MRRTLKTTILTGIAATLVAAPMVTSASAYAGPLPDEQPQSPGSPGYELGPWGLNDGGFFVNIFNQKTNDDAELVRPLFGNTSSFLIGGEHVNPEVMKPNSEASLFGTGGNGRPNNMDFEFKMRDRRVHAWIRVTEDGKVKPTCDLGSDRQAVCYFDGLDKDGYLKDRRDVLRLHISYDQAGPQPK